MSLAELIELINAWMNAGTFPAGEEVLFPVPFPDRRALWLQTSDGHYHFVIDKRNNATAKGL